MNLNGKKLLVLGGAGPHVKVIESAKEMGIYTIAADFLPNSDAKAIADESLNIDIYDIDGLVEYGRKKHIDGVIDFCLDPAQKPAQQIAARLGLPAFGTEQQVLSLTDKEVFKQLCKTAGVDVICEYSVEEIDKVEYPCLVKPGESRGSRGISVCNNIEELKESIKHATKVSNNGKCIIERYMADSQDLTISYLVKDGEPILVSLGDRYPGRAEDNLNRQLTCTIQPSRYTHAYLANADKKIKNMIKMLGIKNGPVFFQGFFDNGTVRLYDPGIRFPGNEYERIYKAATNIDLMKSVISYCVGGEILDYNEEINGSYNLNGKTAIQYMINFGPGKVEKFGNLNKISEIENVVDVRQRHFIGDTIENTGDIKHRAGEVSILCQRKADKMKEIISIVQENLYASDENGRDMLISPFDVTLIDKNYRGEYEE